MTLKVYQSNSNVTIRHRCDKGNLVGFMKLLTYI